MLSGIALPVVLWLGVINLLTALTFWADKRQAVAGVRRVPENQLLMLALLGGSPSAFWARQRFRHKTRKEPFSTYLQLIAMLQVGLLLGLSAFAAMD